MCRRILTLIFLFSPLVLRAELLIPAGSEWKYFDAGFPGSTAWNQSEFDDAAWKSGFGSFAYGDTTEINTILEEYPDGSNRLNASYFRKTLLVSDQTTLESITIRLRCDDGAVVYLNGNEIFRQNMPEGPVQYSTTASSQIISDDMEDGFSSYTFQPAELDLKNGYNLLAVEVHQYASYSDDMIFDLSLSAESPPLLPIGHLRNIILCIGDGMGSEHIKAARLYQGSNLVFEDFPFSSEMTTFSYSLGPTDSAASATAMATGIKVDNRVISIQKPGNHENLESILEYYQKHGKATGLITTDQMTDATPAAFGADVEHRSYVNQIASDYFNQSRPNLLFGGGGTGFTTNNAIPAGYTVITNRHELETLNTAMENRVCGIFGDTALPLHDQDIGSLPQLHHMVPFALDLLDNDPDGFFLMIEEEWIDTAAHDNDIDNVVDAVLELSASVEEILNWMNSRNDTLLIVTADHETGGLSVSDRGMGNYPDASWSTTRHTDEPVPVYALGYNAQQATNVHDNTGIYALMKSEAKIPENLISKSADHQTFSMEWTASSGLVYHLEFTENLDSNTWETVSHQTSSTYRIHFSEPTEKISGFYRLNTK